MIIRTMQNLFSLRFITAIRTSAILLLLTISFFGCKNVGEQTINEEPEIDTPISPETRPTEEIASLSLSNNVGFVLNNVRALSVKIMEEHIDRYCRSFVLSPLDFAIYMCMLNDVCGEDLPLESLLSDCITSISEDNPKSIASLMDDIQALDLSSEFSFVNMALINNGDGRNGAYLSSDIKKTLEQNYYSLVSSGDFHSESFSNAVSKWSHDHSLGRINVKPDIKGLDIYLSSSIFFSCDWFNGFDLSETTDKLFHSYNSSFKLPMMNGEIKNVGYYDGEGFTSIQLDLGQGKFAVNILLPDDKSSFDSLKEVLKAYPLDYKKEASMFVSVPRISITREVVNLNSLNLLGSDDLMLSQNVSIPTVIRVGENILWQNNKFSIDEKGILGMSYTYTPPSGGADGPSEDERKVFIADHPFLFKVVEKSNNIELFAGYFTGE